MSPSLVMYESRAVVAHSLNPPFSEMFSWRQKEGGQRNPQLLFHGDLQETKQSERAGAFKLS